MKTFYAHEPHVNGSTKYEVGDPREADENEVKHLVDLGVLGEKPPKNAKPKAAKPTPLTDKLTRDDLVKIAGEEDVAFADDADEAAIREAIEAKRKG